MNESAAKYIRIFELGASMSGLTGIYCVKNMRTGEICGEIRWHGAFRKYCFFPSDGFLFDASCLRIIVAHIETLMDARRKNKS
jgi:hypothetical protein